MPSKRRWDHCITHRNPEIGPFVAEYFGEKDRNVLVIAAAGFDPRSAVVCRLLSGATTNLRAILIREQRPEPPGDLVRHAEETLADLRKLIRSHKVLPISIFGEDDAVVGGRSIVQALRTEDLSGVTDVVVDGSAMSIGVSFPLIAFMLNRVRKIGMPRNLHVIVAFDAEMDEAIKPMPCDTVSYVHGFKGELSLATNANAAKLWMPQLARGRRLMLRKIHGNIDNLHDVCPILPFPAANPRLGDELAEYFLEEFEKAWRIDTRNIMYAAENDPLDLYRTILSIDDMRSSVFENLGGSKLVLSPVGSKVLALGALMAAIERGLPVLHLEAIGYECPPLPPAEPETPKGDLIHVWLEGEVYPTEEIG
jgi:hypothetical protein